MVAKAVAYERDARWDSAEAMQDAVRELHEALFGPIGFEALATLVLVREFRRKSHAKLTSAQPRAVLGCEPFRLLPAVDDAAGSRCRDPKSRLVRPRA